MQNSNIIIVSNDNDKAKIIASKIVLLRSQDTISVVSYDLINDYFAANNSDLILLYAENIDDTQIITKIKAIKGNSYIIFITEDNNPETLCRAYDLGIDDFISTDTPETLFFMRIMWGLKRTLESKNSEKIAFSLSNQNIIDVNSGFYTKDNSERFLDAEYKNLLASDNRNSYIAILSEKSGNSSVFSPEELADFIKNSKRLTDTAGYLSDDRICLLLNNSSEEGLKLFYERLKKTSDDRGNIFLSAVKISDKPFPQIISALSELHSRAEENNNYLSVFDDNIYSLTENLYLQDSKNQNQKYFNKPEDIFSSVFLANSAICENELPNTQVLFATGKNESTFTFKSDLCYAKIKFSYGNGAKMMLELDYIFYGQEIVEGCEVKPQEFTAELVGNIIKTVAATYKRALNNDE